MDYKKESLKKHREWHGKTEVKVRVPVAGPEDLMLAYTPGVAEACLAINRNPDESFNLTRRWNTVPVITDGTAVLGLGDIGPEAGMPVMEGKCALFKAFGDIDAYPLCLKTQDTEEIIRTIKLLAGNFAGINLEDISAPRCFEIETRLQQELDIPVFHDDQHGTAIVTAAALFNALKLVGKNLTQIRIVINGAGAAGIGIAKFLIACGAKDIVVCDYYGIIEDTEKFNPAQRDLAKLTNPHCLRGTLKDAMKGADVFIGVSVGNIVDAEMVRSMAAKPIMFPLANPVPEISREEALAAGAYIVGTGSSEYPNQINNVLVFPGLFRGALDVKATKINEEMMIAAARGIAACVPEEKLSVDFILPLAYDKSAHQTVAKVVAEAAVKTGVTRK